MRHILVGFVAIVAMTMGQGSVAQLLPSNDARYGASSITYDATTNLDWLDLAFTLNKSFNLVTSELGSGGQFEGFRIAQRSDLDQLFDSAGIQSPRYNPDVANLQPVARLIDLVGITQIDSLYGYQFACGLHGTGGYAGASGTGHSYGCLVASYGGQAITDVGTQNDPDASPYIATWLVRDHVSAVPEPNIALLMVAALGIVSTWCLGLRARA